MIKDERERLLELWYLRAVWGVCERLLVDVVRCVGFDVFVKLKLCPAWAGFGGGLGWSGVELTTASRDSTVRATNAQPEPRKPSCGSGSLGSSDKHSTTMHLQLQDLTTSMILLESRTWKG